MRVWWRAVGAALGVFLCLSAFAASQAAIAQSNVLRVRVGGDAAQTRIVLDIDRSVAARLVSDGADGHLVLSLPGAAVEPGLQGGRHGLVKAWTVDTARGGAQLQLDLADQAVVKRRFLLPPADGVQHYRYVIDLAVNTTALQAPVALPPAAPAARLVSYNAAPTVVVQKSTKASRKAVSLRKVVVIDAGHGGSDPGARGARSWEKDLNLAAALTLKARLERTGRYKVVMTRESDVYVALDSRVRIAQRARADLFISLHSDSGPNATTRGASVYTLSDQASERAQKFVSKDDWFMKASLVGGGVSDILFDLTQRNTRNKSAAFAQTMISHIEDEAVMLRRSHRDAGFMVLLAPNVPAVLLEMGFVSNLEDEAFLRDPKQRANFMDAVGDSIDDYFAESSRFASR